MSIRFHRNGWEVRAYDPEKKKNVYAGRFATEAEAREYFAQMTSAKGENTRRCPGCKRRFVPEREGATAP